MFEITQTVSSEQSVRKSRFVATAVPVTSEQEARDAIAAHSRAEANHNCWAWRIGQAYRFSDDGEPGGTAGKPILAAIDGLSVDNVAVVVTRWFGGILLGTGGLARAYGGTARACLAAASLVPITATIEADLVLGFSDLAPIKARLAAFDGLSFVDESFTETGADLLLRVPEATFAQVARLVADMSSGRSRLAARQPIADTIAAQSLSNRGGSTP